MSATPGHILTGKKLASAFPSPLSPSLRLECGSGGPATLDHVGGRGSNKKKPGTLTASWRRATMLAEV